MKIEYDKKADAKYIHLKSGKVAKTIEKKPWLFFDCDSNGEVIGMEILNASKHPVNFSIKDRNAVGYTVPLEIVGA